MNNQNSKKEVQLLLLNLLVELQEQCGLAGINYYAVGGTLLGAVRHKGFIPWDDDIDVVVLSEDYEKLVSFFEKNLSDDYFLMTRENSPLYFQEYPKLCYKNKRGIVSEIAVDIFIYTPTDIKKKKLRQIQNFMLKYLYLVKRYKVRKIEGKDIKQSSPFKTIFFKLSSIISLKALDKGVCFFINVSGKDNDEYLTDWGSPYHYDKKATFKRSVFASPKALSFEGLEINVPNQYEQFLSTLYGDYMQLPPEEERINHGTTTIGCEDVDLKKAAQRVKKRMKENSDE